MKHGKSPRVLLPILALLMLLLPAQKAFSQGGGGSKGGVVLACFTSDPTKFMYAMPNKPGVYSWPAVTEDPTDPRVGYASKALIFDAVNRLKYVQVAEYYLATTYRSWGGSEDLFGNGAYRLHPLLYAINDLPVSRKAVPEPQFLIINGPDGAPLAFPKEKLYSPARLTTTEEETVFTYVESEESRLKRDRDTNTQIFSQMYTLVSDMFRGVPAFHTRLIAAHEKLGLIPNHESNIWGSNSDQWDSRNLSALTSLPKPPENCLWMTAADRIGDDIIYDRYLWQRMDLFQRVLLQLHEEVYYLGSDASKLGLNQGNVEPTRFMLSRFIRGERTKEDLSGDFASSCAYYDAGTSKRNPPVRFLDSSSCQIGNGLERGPIKGSDVSFLPASRVGNDTTAFIGQFICPSSYTCSQETLKLWSKVARYYGPYSSGAMQTLLANDKYFFGRFSTIDRLSDKRDRAAQIVSNMLVPYETMWGFCDKSGYASANDLAGPPPPRNNPRRLEKKERESIEKRQENPKYVPRTDEPIVKKSDLDEIATENRVFRELRRSVNTDLQVLNQGLGLLSDFPDISLSGPLSNLLLLKTPASFADVTDLEPGRNGKNEYLLQTLCGDVRKRRKELGDFLRITGNPGTPNLTFYERPDEDPLAIRVPR